MLGRIPAQCSELPTKATTTSSSQTKTNVNSMHDESACQQVPFTFGNKSGHFPEHPRTANLPQHHKNRFPFLEQAKRNIAASYIDPLAFEIGRIFFHEKSMLKHGGYRKRRSEIRETICCRVGVAIAHALNIAWWALGKIVNGVFMPYSVKLIASWAGVTISQCRRALNVFAYYGYIVIKPRKYLDQRDGRWKSENPIITVSPDFLLHLGITEEAIREKQVKQLNEQKSQERKQKSAAYNKKQREDKKAGKKALKEIMDSLSLPKTIEKMRKGKYLTEAEKELLKQEMPGHDRTYRDYTGCGTKEPQHAFDMLATAFKPPNDS